MWYLVLRLLSILVVRISYINDYPENNHTSDQKVVQIKTNSSFVFAPIVLSKITDDLTFSGHWIHALYFIPGIDLISAMIPQHLFFFKFLWKCSILDFYKICVDLRFFFMNSINFEERKYSKNISFVQTFEMLR